MAPPRVTYLVPGLTGEEPASGNAEIEDLGEGDAGLGGEDTGGGVKGEQAVHAGGDEEVALVKEADVAVGATHADGKKAFVEIAGDCGEVRLPVERDELGVVVGVAAPGLKERRGGVDGFCGRGWLGHRYQDSWL